MELWVLWLIVAIALLICEVLTQLLWSLCLSIGAVCAMLCALFGAPVWAQIAALSGCSLLAFLVLMPRFRRWQHKGSDARTGMDAMIGKRATLTDAIVEGTPGRVRLDGSSWQVVAPGAPKPVAAGTEVVVTGYNSIILTVKPLSNQQ